MTEAQYEPQSPYADMPLHHLLFFSRFATVAGQPRWPTP